jgi:hypothetical protein
LYASKKLSVSRVGEVGEEQPRKDEGAREMEDVGNWWEFEEAARGEMGGPLEGLGGEVSRSCMICRGVGILGGDESSTISSNSSS